jgi:hypothetical protein
MRQVTRVGTAFNDGRLELSFRDGSLMEVLGMPFEAWARWPGDIDGLKIVSIRGGDLQYDPVGADQPAARQG